MVSFALLAGFAGGQVRPGAPAEIPGGNLPIQPIGANDLVAVSVYDAPEFTRTVRVGADGFVRLPMLKQRIQASGLMPSELERILAGALKEEGLIVDPFVTVTVAEYNSRPISVMGAVRRPLTFQAVGRVTLLDALARAEGLAPEAGPEILVSRPRLTTDGEAPTLVRRITVKTLIDAADPAANLALTGGEEVRVPEAGKLFVVGNVKKPGAFVVRDASETTVLKVLAMAEGLLPYAGRRAYILRREGVGGNQEIPVELAKIMDRKSPDEPLLPNDVLYVPDAHGKRLGLAALEKILLFGSGASSALIYAGVK